MALKHNIYMSIGMFFAFWGILISLAWILGGFREMPVSWFIVSLTMGIGGIYLSYRTYKNQMRNLVARLGPWTEVYYDDKGLYTSKSGKPYLLKWDEVEKYEIVSVYARDEYSQYPPIFNMISYLIWRDIDPEYATTGIWKFGTVRFYKKDGSVVTLPNTLNPDRFTLIFNKYIYESNQKSDQKKGYHHM